MPAKISQSSPGSKITRSIGYFEEKEETLPTSLIVRQRSYDNPYIGTRLHCKVEQGVIFF